MSSIQAIVESIEIKELLHQVKLHPVLYDKSQEGNRNKPARNQAWKEIQMAVIPGAEKKTELERNAIGIVLTQKWTHIRDVFVKYCKAKVNNKHVKPYIYAREMQFLEKYLNLPTTIDNTDKNNETVNVESDAKETQEGHWKLSEIDIIKAVEAHPIIWDKTLHEYGSIIAKKKSWFDITAAVIPGFCEMDTKKQIWSVNSVRETWEKVQSTYVKYKKGQGMKSYVYAEELRFLDPFLTDPAEDDEDSPDDEEPGTSFLTKLRNQDLSAFGPAPTKNLIQAIKSRPPLWNTLCDDYNDNKKRFKSWNEVCKVMIPNYSALDKTQRKSAGIMIKKRWNHLRCSYSKEVEKSNKHDNTSFVYKDDMKFLNILYEDEDKNKTTDAQDSDCEMTSEDERICNEETNDLETREEPSNTSDHPKTMDDNKADLAIINAIKKYPVLWNRTHEQYTNSYVKPIAWNDVFNIIKPGYSDIECPEQRKMAGELIKSKWRNLHDTYMGYLKKKQQSPNIKPYIFEKEINFLDGNFGAEANDEDEDNREMKIDIVDEFEKQMCKISGKLLEPHATVSSITSNRENGTNEKYNNIAIPKSVKETENDDDRSFLTSLTPVIKVLSEKSKFKFKIEVMTLIKKLKEEDENMHNKEKKQNNEKMNDVEIKSEIYRE